jgi:hypothetical protein
MAGACNDAYGGGAPTNRRASMVDPMVTIVTTSRRLGRAPTFLSYTTFQAILPRQDSRYVLLQQKILYISPHKPSTIEAQGREHEVKE